MSLIFRHVLKKEAIPGDSRKQSTSHQCEDPSSSPHWENRFLILNSPSSPGKDIDVCAKEGTCWGKSEGGKKRGEEERRWDKWECFVWLLLRKDTDCGAVLQGKFHKSFPVQFTCSGCRLKSHHAWLVEKEKPISSTRSHLLDKKRVWRKKRCLLITLSSPGRLPCSLCWRR